MQPAPLGQHAETNHHAGQMVFAMAKPDYSQGSIFSAFVSFRFLYATWHGRLASWASSAEGEISNPGPTGRFDALAVGPGFGVVNDIDLMVKMGFVQGNILPPAELMGDDPFPCSFGSCMG